MEKPVSPTVMRSSVTVNVTVRFSRFAQLFIRIALSLLLKNVMARRSAQR